MANVRHITSVLGPLIAHDGPVEDGRPAIDSDGRVINPGHLTAEFVMAGTQARCAGVHGRAIYYFGDGEMRLSSVLSLEHSDPDHSITPTMIRSLPFEELAKEVVRVLRHHQSQASDGLHWSMADYPAAQPPGRGRRRQVTQDLLLRIAEAYARLVDAERPYEELRHEFHLSAGYLRQLVSKARAEGLLGPARHGQRNHQLTSKAYDLLNQKRLVEDGDDDGPR